MSSDEQNAPHSRRKQVEAMHRALASTVVEQLAGSGCEPGQLIDFASEVLRCIMDRGFEDRPGSTERSSPEDADRQPIAFSLACSPREDLRIQGKRIALRAVQPADRALLEAWAGQEEIARTLSREHLERVLTLLSGDLAGPEGDVPLVICGETGQAVGMVCLFGVDSGVRQAEMTKLLGSPAARGKGYATEAVKVALAYAFTELNLRRIYLRTAGFNFQNIRINENVGFRFEGVLRRSLLLAGEVVDVALMSILSEEFHRLYHVEGG